MKRPPQLVKAQRQPPIEIAGRFALPGAVVGVEPFHGGHINDSWILTAGGERFLLQRVNPRVFPRGDLVMENVARVTALLARGVDGTPDAHRRALRLVPTADGAHSWADGEGARWRVFPFIERSVSRERAESPEDAHRAARAFGELQRALATLGPPRLHETIPGFHDTPRRVAALERAARADAAGRLAAARAEVADALGSAPLARALADRQASRELPERVAHNDAKMSNVLLDARTGAALCVVDLDTVMPGLALHDFGDMARSMSSDAAEDEPDPSRVSVVAERFAALAQGYQAGAGDLLSRAERGLLVTAARVITYEQAVRFLTDWLEGDVYYKTSRPGHNLERARAQLALLAAFTRSERELSRLAAS